MHANDTNRTPQYFGAEFETAFKEEMEFLWKFLTQADDPCFSDLQQDSQFQFMMESIAWRFAQERLRIATSRIRMTSDVLSVLDPHHLSPLPSFALVQFPPCSTPAGRHFVRDEMIQPIPKNDDERARFEYVRFSLCYALSQWPVKLVEVAYDHEPADRCTLRLSLDVQTPIQCEKGQKFDRLRFFLNGELAPQLYESLLHGACQARLQCDNGDSSEVRIRRVGFAQSETLLPYPATTFRGFRLLSDYFAFPKKYSFVDFRWNPRKVRTHEFRHIEIVIPMKYRNSDLADVNTSNFVLDVVPAVNLFEHPAKPIDLTAVRRYEHKLAPEGGANVEVFGVKEVVRQIGNSKPIVCDEFLEVRFPYRDGYESQCLWAMRKRRESHVGNQRETATIALVEPGDEPLLGSGKNTDFLQVQLICTNGDQAAGLESHNWQTAKDGISCTLLEQPTATWRPPCEADIAWRLPAALALHCHTARNETASGRELYRVLQLQNFFDFSPSEWTRAETRRNEKMRSALRGIEGITVSGDRNTRRYRLRLSDEHYPDGVYLFGSVLAAFLRTYVSYDDRVELCVNTKKKELRWISHGDRMLP